LTRNPQPAVELPDLDTMLSELCRWAAGMPWVGEKPRRAQETLTLFMIECELLYCHEPWFAINATEEENDDGLGIIVILPGAVTERAASLGCPAGIEPIGKRRSVTAIALPTCDEEFRGLQRLLEVTYAASFEPSN
jgi:hypothetical protein